MQEEEKEEDSDLSQSFGSDSDPEEGTMTKLRVDDEKAENNVSNIMRNSIVNF
jgi:hypothetical protein